MEKQNGRWVETGIFRHLDGDRGSEERTRQISRELNNIETFQWVSEYRDALEKELVPHIATTPANRKHVPHDAFFAVIRNKKRYCRIRENAPLMAHELAKALRLADQVLREAKAEHWTAAAWHCFKFGLAIQRIYVRPFEPLVMEGIARRKGRKTGRENANAKRREKYAPLRAEAIERMSRLVPTSPNTRDAAREVLKSFAHLEKPPALRSIENWYKQSEDERASR